MTIDRNTIVTLHKTQAAIGSCFDVKTTLLSNVTLTLSGNVGMTIIFDSWNDVVTKHNFHVAVQPWMLIVTLMWRNFDIIATLLWRDSNINVT